MFGKQQAVRLGFLIALALPLAGAVACGGAKSDVQHAKVKPGDMPEGAEWSGVYYSPTFGNLHLVKEGGSISGKWRTAAGDKWGELHGDVTGDLLRYEWSETTIGMVGPTAKSKGKGYFKYVVPPGENVEHEIRGEWGLDASDAGNPWTAIKQRNQKPDPDSVMPDETQQLQGDDWDKSRGGESQDSDSDSDGWD